MATRISSSVCAILLCCALVACAKKAEPPPVAAAPQPCDRACLEGFMAQYLDALVAHDPSRLPVTASVTFVENNQRLKLGEGSWNTVTALGEYRHYFADPQAGQGALITVVRENDADILFDLRLKVTDRKISEVETMVIRDRRGAANYVKLARPDAVWLEAVPPEQRATREQLAETANKYFTSMQMNDGKGDYSFFADDCDRLEHGLKTTNNERQNYGHSDDAEFVTLSCAAQFKTGFLGFVTRIRDRRYLVIDEERQAVFAFNFFDHNGTIRSIPLTSGKTFRIPPFFSTPRTLQVGEAFRAKDNKIFRIEMTLNEYPYGMKPAWPTQDPAPIPESITAGKPLELGNGACDRACLDQAVDGVLAALTTRDPSRAPLAAKVRYTENEQQLAIGDGLWGTATKIGPYRLTVADTSRGQVAYLGRIDELDNPGILALRLRVADGLVSEIEAVIAREELPRHDTLFRPRLIVEPAPQAFTRPDALFTKAVAADARASRDALIEIANRYFDGIELGKSAEVPFAPDCSRRENGVPTTGDKKATAPDPATADFKPFSRDCAGLLDSAFLTYIDDLRDRRPWVVDEERGVIFTVAYADIPGKLKSIDSPGVGPITLPATLGIPYSLISPSVIKVEGGKIRRIEGVSKSAPYRVASGWSGS